MKRIIKRNLLVQYKGGGYDGCFWEWNFFLFDAKGKFHVLSATGRMGIKTEKEACELLKGADSGQFYTYRLTDKAAIKEFQNETAASYVEGVTAKVNAIYGKDVLHWECDNCLNECAGEMFHDGYKGDGGIGVQMLGKICEDCYCSGLCFYCGEYSGEDDLDSDGYCECCAESHKAKAVQS